MIFTGDEEQNTTGSIDYKVLYEKELQINDQLRCELDITQTQSNTFSRELSHLFVYSKEQRRELSTVNNQLVKYAADLRATIGDLKEAHQELQDAYRDTIFRLVRASEYKDKDTGNHLSRMSRYSTLLARKMGLSEQQIENISYASPMHDVGKIGIPDHIILKRGMLTAQEFLIVKSHTIIGAGILANTRGTVLQAAQTIAHFHHEHWSGDGYPEGLKHDRIPLLARIVALTDTFDALTSQRPYKTPYPIDVSCDIIEKQREKHFDPEITNLFLDNIEEFIAIKRDIDQQEPLVSSKEVILSERDQMCMV